MVLDALLSVPQLELNLGVLVNVLPFEMMSALSMVFDNGTATVLACLTPDSVLPATWLVSAVSVTHDVLPFDDVTATVPACLMLNSILPVGAGDVLLQRGGGKDKFS